MCQDQSHSGPKPRNLAQLTSSCYRCIQCIVFISKRNKADACAGKVETGDDGIRTPKQSRATRKNRIKEWKAGYRDAVADNSLTGDDKKPERVRRWDARAKRSLLGGKRCPQGVRYGLDGIE